MTFISSKINWILLSKGLSYYEENGFKYIETPYFVSPDYNSLTKPHNDISFILSNGIFENNNQELVGSAEQGFIYLLIKDLLTENKYCSITPCFRTDDYDKLHQPYFMKLELFLKSDKNEDLIDIINISKKFFESLTKNKIDIIKTSDISYDLYLNEIEIGSYGIRHLLDKSFIYGTGIALPRFSLADDILKD